MTADTHDCSTLCETQMLPGRKATTEDLVHALVLDDLDEARELLAAAGEAWKDRNETRKTIDKVQDLMDAAKARLDLGAGKEG